MLFAARQFVDISFKRVKKAIFSSKNKVFDPFPVKYAFSRAHGELQLWQNRGASIIIGA